MIFMKADLTITHRPLNCQFPEAQLLKFKSKMVI